MLLKEFLEAKAPTKQFTFLVGRAVKDDSAPHFHLEYRQTPISLVREWLEAEEFCNSHYVMNPNHPPIDMSGSWSNHYKRGTLRSAMIVSMEELQKCYHPKQAQELIDYYDKVCREDMFLDSCVQNAIKVWKGGRSE